MADRNLPHLLVLDSASSREFRRRGQGGRSIRPVTEPRGHADALRQGLGAATDAYLLAAEATGLEPAELQASGIVLAVEGAAREFPLQLDSLDARSRHKPPRVKWALLSVQPPLGDQPETALVWVADEYVDAFLLLIERYAEEVTPTGRPRNEGLVANMSAIRAAVARDLWTSPGEPPSETDVWWELWLRRSESGLRHLQTWAEVRQLDVAADVLRLDQRDVVLLQCPWHRLVELPFTAVPVAEIRLAPVIDSILDLSPSDQDELVSDLVDRLEPLPGAPGHAVAVCILDTGIMQGHVLLEASTSNDEVHTVFPSGSTTDDHGHGTWMAGLALLGPLEPLLVSGLTVRVRHRLESVRLHGVQESERRAERFPVNTARAVALPEVGQPDRRRVFALAITATEGDGSLPSTWSATIDALAAGIDVDATGAGVSLLGPPDSGAARLFLVCAGNRRDDGHDDYLDRCDLAVIHDPSQAWNAITVGAHTDITTLPSDPSLRGWQAVANEGDLSPYSSTGVQLESQWPNKPDICMEGGNYIHDGSGFASAHASMSLLTTDRASVVALGPMRDTSAATAQAARLAALARAEYPSYWPETVRGLLVHAAEWTPAMRSAITGSTSKVQQRSMLRRYGWGVPTPAAVLHSASDAVTLIAQDEFQPFHGSEFAMREFRLHELPWPGDELRALGSETVRLRVTLSYFIEPNASRRGWRRKFTYQSHGLRFDIRHPLETTNEFVRRVNRDAERDEDGNPVANAGPSNWLVGAQNRNRGSLHADMWTGSARELAECSVLAVHGVGGWWKNNRRKDRMDLPVRYALLVSLETVET